MTSSINHQQGEICDLIDFDLGLVWFGIINSLHFWHLSKRLTFCHLYLIYNVLNKWIKKHKNKAIVVLGTLKCLPCEGSQVQYILCSEDQWIFLHPLSGLISNFSHLGFYLLTSPQLPSESGLICLWVEPVIQHVLSQEKKGPLQYVSSREECRWKKGKKSESMSACRDWQLGLARLIAPLFLVLLQADSGCRRAPVLRVRLNKPCEHSRMLSTLCRWDVSLC